jgi:alpha-1,2-rhamnosyltransferase
MHSTATAAAKAQPARLGRRIYIDFTLMDYRTRVTGIPRVAYAYLEEGYSLMAEHGFELIPVHLRDGELTDARPFLVGSNLRHFKRHPSLASFHQLLRSWLYFLLHALRLGFISLLVPPLKVTSFLLSFEFFDLWRNVLHAGFRKVYFALKRRTNNSLSRHVEVQPGDVLFMPGWWHDTPPGFYRRLRQQGVIVCPLVHDILPITHPEHYESPWREQFKRWVFEVLSHSDHIYYVSDATRKMVEAVNAEEFNRKLPSGTVLHHGSDFTGGRKSPQQPNLPAVRSVIAGAPYFLMVGSLEPKKNHLKVLEEFDSLWARNVQVQLVIVGRPGWKDEHIRRTLSSHPCLHTSLIWLEGVGDEDLSLLYQNATAVIQASEAEGFGLPIIEAFALGAPVLANDIPVFREVAQSHATFFDMHSEGDLAQKVEQCLQGGLSLAEDFSWPTWNERARFLYRDLLARAQPQTLESAREFAALAPKAVVEPLARLAQVVPRAPPALDERRRPAR